MICFFPITVLASGNVSVSTSNLSITKGSTASFTISANNAAGRIDISSANSGVASVSTSSLFLDMQSTTVTVTGNSVGTTTIKVYAVDVTTYDDEDLTGKTFTINVTVTEPTINNNGNKPSTNNSSTNSNLSQNNDIKTLAVDGFDLVKVDNNNYTLSVSNSVTSIIITATAYDAKAKVSGGGIHKLDVGENNIEIVVTSESGSKNKINVKVTRKDGYYLEDLDSLLSDSGEQDISIIINVDSQISAEQLAKIKESGKVVNLNYYDENKKLIYSWSIDGQKIRDTEEFLTSVSYISEYVTEISKLSNYADGLYVNVKHNGNLPEGTKFKLYVGDKFTDGSIVNVYGYDKDENKLELFMDGLTVADEGYIEFDIDQGLSYFVTMSNIVGVSKKEASSIDLFVVIPIMELVVIIAFIAIYLLRIRPIIKEKNNKNMEDGRLPKSK